MTNHLPESSYLAGERQAELAELTFAELQAEDMDPSHFVNWTYSIESELAVVGHDPEYADMENPRGEIVRERFFMVATDEIGQQFRYGWEKSAERAEAVFQYVAPPVSEWSLWRCIYGSVAYERNGCESAQLMEEMEADLGPNWMVRAPEVAFALAAKGAI